MPNQYTNINAPWRDEQTLRELYVEQEFSTTEIGDILGCAQVTIWNWLNKFNIELRSRARANKHASYRIDSTGYEVSYCYDPNLNQEQAYIHRLIAVAEYGFEAVADKQVHHKNGVPWDNRPENIEVMGISEHTKKHWESGDLHSGLFTK